MSLESKLQQIAYEVRPAQAKLLRSTFNRFQQFEQSVQARLQELMNNHREVEASVKEDLGVPVDQDYRAQTGNDGIIRFVLQTPPNTTQAPEVQIGNPAGDADAPVADDYDATSPDSRRER